MKLSRDAILIIGWALLMGFVFLVTDSIDTINHEAVHQQIYDEYGINSTINYNYTLWIFPTSGDTEAFERNLTAQDSRDLNLLHAQTELVGYQIHSLTTSVVLCFGILFLILLLLLFK